MEMCSAVASVTGILAFAGQTIDSILKLQRIFQGCANASKSIDRFLRDLNSLIQTLEEVNDIATKLKDTTGSVAEGLLASLKIQLEDCSKDVYAWVRKAGEAHPSFSNGTKATFKKFLVAVNKDQNDMIYQNIATHRSNIHIKLSIIGR
jgi:ABC-type transporter Mla subunit MlaD